MKENEKREIQKIVDDSIRKAMGFSQRKLGDTPTDTNQLTPQGYVDANGTIANRPIGSIANIGQSYYATDINIPIVFDGQKWRNGIGSIIANN